MSSILEAVTHDCLIGDCLDGLQIGGLFGLLRVINATTPYRFTGIYHFEGRWVKSVRLYDRERPDAQLGSDVLWDDSYCRLTSADGDRCEIVESQADGRLGGHAAREAVQSYVALLLRNADGTHYGTLCHYDVVPRPTPEDAFGNLRNVRPLVEQALTSGGRSIEAAQALRT